MAKFILKWRYVQPGSPKHNQHLVQYIATRNGVEKCEESWKMLPVTREQKRLIGELLRDYPAMVESREYEDYCQKQNRYTASRFIDKAIDENIDLIGKRENYVKYIAMRPRVEKQGAHGLFSQEDEPLDVDEIARAVASHDGVVWTTILSLRREDAIRLGYDNAVAWRKMLRRTEATLADAMGIHIGDLRWYAAFHNEGNHPHVHLVSYSVGEQQPYITEQKLHKLKAAYANCIFKQDLMNTFERQTKLRDELRQLGKERMHEIVNEINNGSYENEIVEAMMLKLQESLKNYKGKMVYGYLPKQAKNLINGIVDELAKDDRIKELYDLWYEQKEDVIRTYTDKMPERTPLSQNEEFKSIRNAVIREMMNLAQEGDVVENLPPDEDDADEPRVQRDSEHTVNWLEAAVEQGNPYAEYVLGKMLLNGDGVEQDIPRAEDLLRHAAGKGNKFAIYKLARELLDGGLLRRNVGEALALFESIASDNPNAAYLAGKIYLTEEGFTDTTSAIRYFEMAASQGNTYAQFQLGKMYLLGKGVPKDEEKANEYLKAAADNGNRFAENLMHTTANGRHGAVGLGVFRLFGFLANTIRDQADPRKRKRGAIDRKEQQRINEKKLAHGLKIE